jgi:hypothetical protein
VKILLDENFPLPLLRVLRATGIEAEQIITLSHQQLSDREVQDRLRSEPVVFLTEDAEFLTGEPDYAATVLVSRVKPCRPLEERLSLWVRSVRHLVDWPTTHRLFELTDGGDLRTMGPRSGVLSPGA